MARDHQHNPDLNVNAARIVGESTASASSTPAVAAGIANAPLIVLDLVKMIEAEESKLQGRLTDYLPAKRDSK